MNAAHWHLIVNHISLFTLVIGTGVLIAQMKRRSVDLRILAVVLFVVTAVFAFVADQTGDSAAEIVKALGSGFDAQIHEHDEAAEWALRSGILVGLLALGMEWAARKKPTWFKPLQWVLLVFAIQGCAVFARTAYLGGMIRHTEIHADQAK